VKADKVSKFSLGNTLTIDQAAIRVVNIMFVLLLPLQNKLF